MKFTKMSLIAALLVGSSAFAVDNIEVAGNAKLFYSTDDSNNVDLFDKTNAFGQAALGLGVTADLADGVKAGTHLTALSTLGLQGQLVDGVWEGTNGVDDSYWFDEAWIAKTMGKTTVKIGRMQLDTPLVFSEDWSIAINSFEAAVVVNQDIQDTTIVGGYVGGSNGAKENTGGLVIANMNDKGNTNFSQFYQGAYTIGAVNNSYAPLTAQAWYYNASHILSAYWLQADLNLDGILAGAQYTATDFNDDNVDSTYAFAVMAGYEMKDTFVAKVAFSQVCEDGAAGANLSGSGMSKLYTESWYTWIAAQQDTKAYNLTLEAPVKDIVDLGLYYTYADQDEATGGNDLTELTLTASKSFGSLDTAVAYINTVAGNQDNDAVNTLQVFLTYNY